GILEQQTFPLVIANFGFRIGDGKLVASRVCAERPVQQVEVARYFVLYRLQATCTGHFQACVQFAFQPDVSNDLVLAVMLFYEIGSAFGVKGRKLPVISSEIDRSRAEILPEIHGPGFQILDFYEHRNLRAPTPYRKGPRKCTQRRKSR